MLPNYNDGSIVNLMSSISNSFGVKTQYNSLKILPPEKLKKNVLLIVIDGLGYNYLISKNSSLPILGSMTSVFPSTTGAAITSFYTGVPVQQHASPGWFVFLKEIGIVSIILRFSPRSEGSIFSESGIKIENIINQDSFTSKLKAKSFAIAGKNIVNSDFSKLMTKKAKRLSYDNLNGFFKQINKALNSTNSRKYIFAYWPKFDALSHKHGIESQQSERHFKILEKRLNALIKKLKTDTTLIITSDHGFISAEEERVIKLEDHPKLKECLTMPFCGDSRVIYCYVHPSKTKQFEDYLKHNLSKYCDFYKSQELIDKNYFGLFEPNPKLFDRVGDYVLICKKNYIIKDLLENEEREKNIGHHSGISEDEMLVPLIVIN